MITESAIPTTKKEFVPAHPEFRLGPPGNNPLVPAAPVSFTQCGSGFDFEWTEEVLQSSGAHAKRISDDIILRSRQDVERGPSSARAHSNLGLALLTQGRTDEAARELERALQLNPTHYVAAVSIARVKVLQSRFAEAEGIYRGLCRTYPANTTLLTSLAHIAIRQGEYGEAASLLRQVIDIGKDAPASRYLLAISLLRTGQYREAAAHLRAATHSEVRSPLLHHALGVAYVLLGNHGRAIRSFRTALTLAPGMREAVHALANVLLWEGKIDESVCVLADYLGDKPDDLEAREILAGDYKEQGQYKNARLQLAKVLESIPDEDKESPHKTARLANNIGVCLDFEGNAAEAERWLASAIELCPDRGPTSYHNLARLYMRTDRPRRAEQVLAACRVYFPEDQGTRLLLSLSLQRQNRIDEAVTELQGLVGGGNAVPEAYADLGWLLSDEKVSVDAALDVLRAGHERFPNHAAIVNNLAYVLLMRGEPAAARTVLESFPRRKWPKTVPVETTLTATWGLLRLWEGDLEEGEAFYREADKIASMSGDPLLARTVKQKMRLELARAYIRLGNLESALHQVRLGLSVKDASKAYRRDLGSLDAKLQGRLQPD